MKKKATDHSHPSKKKRRKTSCQSNFEDEEQRRILRAKYRELSDDIDYGRGKCGGNSGGPTARDVNNALFRNVEHTRELVLDAKNLNAIAELYRSQADARLQVSEDCVGAPMKHKITLLML